MPFSRILVKPGFNTQATQTLNEGGWSLGNRVRFRYGLIEKLAGWTKLFPQGCAGTVRAIHAYEDLALDDTLLIGTDEGAQVYASGQLVTVQFLTSALSGLTFTYASGSTLVTVTGTTQQLAVGQALTVPRPLYLGISSIADPNFGTDTYVIPTGTPLKVASSTPTSFTFNLPTPCTADGSTNAIPSYTINFNATTTATIVVEILGHGLSVGSPYTIGATTVLQYADPIGNPSSLTVTAGQTFPVSQVLSSLQFSIVVPATSDGSGFTYTMNEGANYVAGLSNTPAVQLWVLGDDPSPPGSNWSVDNFGQYGILCPAGGPMFQYTPPLDATTPLVNLGSSAPQINEGFFVAMPQAQIIAYGSEATIGGGAQDPLLVRWSDVGNQNQFIGSITNQAGSLRLSRGSRCIGGLQAPQTSLIWTDVDLWSMAYVGVGDGDSIYSFSILGSGCGLIGQKAATVLGRNTYWMSQKSFWMFGDGGVQAIECPLWDQVFDNLLDGGEQRVVAGANSAAQEVFFFYPSQASSGENDSYIKFNVLENVWDYGTLARSAWIDESVFGAPIAADLNGYIQQHETGFDDDDQAMGAVYAETGFTDLSDGTQMMFVDQIIPDFKWIGDGGFVNMTLFATRAPGVKPTMHGPFSVTRETALVSTGGIRARQVAIRIDWGARTGFNARLGAVRVRAAPNGRN